MNKKLKGILLILFAPTVIFWSILGFYDYIVYGHKDYEDINLMIIELKEAVKRDLS
jgi:TM2 domain-containing membrane protein YozV